MEYTWLFWNKYFSHIFLLKRNLDMAERFSLSNRSHVTIKRLAIKGRLTDFGGIPKVLRISFQRYRNT